MKFDHPLTDTPVPGDPEHDPNGEAIQCHDLPTGELLITFSPEWAAEQDYQIGDIIVFDIDETTGKMELINQTRQAREQALP